MIAEPLRMVSIDPGTSWAGITASEIDPDLTTMRVLESYTINIDRILNRWYQEDDREQGSRVAKLRVLEDAVYRFLCAWRPTLVCCEDPYFRRFPQPYRALIECVMAIRSAIKRYDAKMQLTVFEPSTVKTGVGISGKDGDKEKIRRAIQQMPDLILDMDALTISRLSEHACDSIAVGYYLFSHHIRG